MSQVQGEKIAVPPMGALHRPHSDAPIGLLLAQTGRALERAFDEALARAGGSRPTWLVLLAVMSGSAATQTALAETVGVTGPTLVHHIDKLEATGLVTRTIDPSNRRIRTLQLTERGRTAFFRMREAAMAFDAMLRSGITETELATLRAVLSRLRSNVQTTT